MTSGVKPALPPMLMMKAGTEGKGARGRTPQPDFAEALGVGKQTKQARSPEATMAAPEGGAVPAWPRLATKLGSTFEFVRNAQPNPGIESTGAVEEPGNTSGDDDLPVPAMAAEAPLERDAQRPNDLHPAAMGPAPIVLPGRQEFLPRKGTQPVAAEGSIATGVRPAAVGNTSPAHPTGDARAAEDPTVSTNPMPEAPKAVSFVPLRASERTQPQHPQSATRPNSTESSTKEGRESGGEIFPEAAEPVRAAPRITVVSQQNVPAPMASTALVLVDSIAGSTLLAAPNTAPSSNAIHAAATHASAQSLKIQLHPAELGMVTATLRFAGERLSIELKVENDEAYRRLTNDSDTIVGSLRDLGYDIEKVTVLQPTIASSAAPRSDSPAALAGQASRWEDPSTSTMSNGGNAGSGESSPGGSGNNGHGSQKSQSDHPESGDGGLYI